MRYWEIDVARGIAVLLMIIYHFIFDLFFPSHNQFYWLAILTASTFILVSGISLSISYSRGSRFKKFAKRGFKLLVLAGIITIISFLLLKQGYILFGILHFFGLSSFLIYPFIKYSKSRITALFGILFIVLGIVLLGLRVDFDYFIWLGLVPATFYTFDFFPIFPWFGLLLLGTHIGSRLYPNGKGAFSVNYIGNGTIPKILQFFGKNSLVIYFIHQPIILLILYFFWRPEVLSLINL